MLDDNLVVVRLLLNHGANVNKLDEDSWTPLHAAAANGHHQIARSDTHTVYILDYIVSTIVTLVTIL